MAKSRRRGVDPREVVVRLAALPPVYRLQVLRAMGAEELKRVDREWRGWAMDGQTAPERDWRVWLIRAGRGFGKTRAGAEWVSAFARDNPGARIALVAATVDEARRVMIEGESGLLSVAPDDERPVWRARMGEVAFASGAVAQVFSAAAGEKLRGAQHHAAWCDELGKWRGGTRAWDNLMLGLRLGDNPRVLVTTTPRPTELMYRVMAMAGFTETCGSTRDNPYLAESFAAAMHGDYGGTRLGRQELEGELIEDRDGGLWSRDRIEACRVAEAPALLRVVVAVDPPAGGEGADEGNGTGDACGIVAAGLGEDGLFYVIDDASIAGASPARWAAAVADCAARHGADRVVAEKNQGGAMVRAVLTGADVSLPLTLVHASLGKVARAEPVSLQYESGRVRHVGAFPALEDQLCGMLVAGGYAGPGRSPDRADALVWALTELLQPRGKARVRRL
ncbi:DNA-packaging protein [Sphingomonas sp.]|jgi:phage terminase large subunit-like protein|uniref:DNA-packaging protein n=1 Tax=Sphingomonas sp. TaxID=28214 RepID=UPI002E2F3374|nr:terminase family protein [Sphingomonas sp.]HEX4695707.1 terminase family protein [Sphingomonas sp.]